MIRITALGTSAAIPSKQRGQPAFALRVDGDVFLLDCGEGTQRQMMHYGVSYAKVRAIFITHTHADHILGLAGLIFTMRLAGRSTPLDIYVPRGGSHAIAQLLGVASCEELDSTYKIHIHEVGLEKQEKIFGAEKFEFHSFPVSHSRASVGYIFQQKPILHFNKKLCDKLGIQGKMFREITENGKINVKMKCKNKLQDKTILLTEVTSLERGVKVVYSGDTVACASLEKSAKGADLLIHEATYSSERTAEAEAHSHTTAKQAAAIAKKAGVKLLWLTHMSPRYKEKDELEKEAKAIFRNSVVAEDGMAAEF